MLMYNINEKYYHYCLLVSLNKDGIILRSLIFILLIALSPISYSADFSQLLQLIDYIGVDYEGAVDNGEVINQGEYGEMQDFSQGIAEKIAGIDSGIQKPHLLEQSQQLINLIKTRADIELIRKITTDMRLVIVNNFNVTVIPRKAPDMARAETLYQQNCVGCHGVNGDGHGPLANGMNPAPINFTDKNRYAQRTLFGLYNTITHGVPDTKMQSFQQMSMEDRWALAFYVGQFAVKSDYDEISQQMANSSVPSLLDLKKFTVTTPAEAESSFGEEGSKMMTMLRNNPRPLFNKESPISFTQNQLDAVKQAYMKKDYDGSYQLAVEAYLEGFELVEQKLDAVDSGLRRKIEQAMTGLRNQIRAQVGFPEVEASIEEINNMLNLATERMNEGNLSGSTVFVSALFILLREGLEALLVVAALIAFLIKTEHRANVRYLHFGWIGALLAGGLTWWASITIIDISGASREMTEGIASLLAAVILFYVGFWLHDKTNAVQWKAFIQNSMQKALSTGTLWGLAGLSFIAVYREVFESILFFQALWVQADKAGKTMAVSGIATGALLLTILAWIVFRLSIRLPLRQFFNASGVLMLALAVIFAGKGVAALQEAGYINFNPVNMPRIDLLGIYPNMQGLVVQGVLLLLAFFLWYGLPRKRGT